MLEIDWTVIQNKVSDSSEPTSGYLIIACIQALDQPEPGTDFSWIPLSTLLSLRRDPSLSDILLFVLMHRSLSADDHSEPIDALIELLTPLVALHPHPAYRLIAFKTLNRWLTEIPNDQTVFVTVKDIIESQLHPSLTAVVIGVIRDLVQARPVSCASLVPFAVSCCSKTLDWSLCWSNAGQ